MLLVLSWIAGDRRRVWFRRQALWVPIAKADGAGSGFRGGFRRFRGRGRLLSEGPTGIGWRSRLKALLACARRWAHLDQEGGEEPAGGPDDYVETLRSRSLGGQRRHDVFYSDLPCLHQAVTKRTMFETSEWVGGW